MHIHKKIVSTSTLYRVDNWWNVYPFDMLNYGTFTGGQCGTYRPIRRPGRVCTTGRVEKFKFPKNGTNFQRNYAFQCMWIDLRSGNCGRNRFPSGSTITYIVVARCAALCRDEFTCISAKSKQKCCKLVRQCQQGNLHTVQDFSLHHHMPLKAKLTASSNRFVMIIIIRHLNQTFRAANRFQCHCSDCWAGGKRQSTMY